MSRRPHFFGLTGSLKEAKRNTRSAHRKYTYIFIACNSSCGKVMFSQVSVHGADGVYPNMQWAEGCVSQHAMGLPGGVCPVGVYPVGVCPVGVCPGVVCPGLVCPHGYCRGVSAQGHVYQGLSAKRRCRRPPPWQTPPKTATKVGGTHSTGMYSCFTVISTLKCIEVFCLGTISYTEH